MSRYWCRSALSILASALRGVFDMRHGVGEWLAYQFKVLAYAPALYLAPLCLAPQTRRANGNTRSLRAIKHGRLAGQCGARVAVNPSIPATRLGQATEPPGAPYQPTRVHTMTKIGTSHGST